MSAYTLELRRFEGRFRLRFNHAAASRAQAASVVCIARGADGLAGYGEGCPRDYVTGETTASAFAAFARWKPSIERSVRDLATLRQWLDRNRTDIDADPAAFAAIEIALLDLFARRAGQPLEAFLGVRPCVPATVTAVFGVAGALPSGLLAAGYRSFGMSDAKIKLSSDPAADRRRIRIIRRLLGAEARLRVDANNLFDDVERCARHLQAIDSGIWAIEEPLRPRDVEGQNGIAARTGMRIILDESAVREADLEGLGGERFVVNLRISKHGGLLRSIAMAEAARARGLAVIIGSHVGETSLLTRTALTLAAACGDRLLAAECGYGSYLLRRDLTDPALRFGRRGVLRTERAGITSAAGLGLMVDEASLTASFAREPATDLPAQMADASCKRMQ